MVSMKIPERPEAILALANRVHLARSDMSEVHSYFWFHLRDTMPEYVDPVFLAMIVIYARPFVQSHSAGKAAPKLVPTEIGLFDGHADLEYLHNVVIERRHRAVAHSDWEYHSTSLHDTPRGLVRRKPRVDYMRGIKLDEFKRLVCYVEGYTRRLAYDLDVAYLQTPGAAPLSAADTSEELDGL